MSPLTGTALDRIGPYLKVETDCIVCNWCKYNCPVENCISFDARIAHINPDTCIECDRCIFVCPVRVIVPLRQARPKSLSHGQQ